MINEVLGSPLCAGIGPTPALRLGGPDPQNICIAGSAARADFGVGSDRVVWAGETAGIRHRATLWLHRESEAWFWVVEAESKSRNTGRRHSGAGSWTGRAWIFDEQRGLRLAGTSTITLADMPIWDQWS